MDLLRDSILIIGIPREYHDTLSRWAAKHNLKNLAHTATVETMAVEAICEYIDRMEQMEANLKPTDEMAETTLATPGRDSVDCSELQNCTTSDWENSLEFSTISGTTAGSQRRSK